MNATSFKRFFFPALLAAVLAVGSCIKPPDYGDTPTIEFLSMSKSTVVEGTDTVEIYFKFTDGDGDLGPLNDQDSTINLFLIDSRDNTAKPYQLPNLTPGGNIKAISGEVTVKVRSFACRAGYENDEIRYTIYVKDRSGNQSNTIQTDPIIIDCQ